MTRAKTPAIMRDCTYRRYQSKKRKGEEAFHLVNDYVSSDRASDG